MWTILLILLSILFIVITTTRFQIHPFLALLMAAFLFGVLNGMSPSNVIEVINSGFGGTMAKIGIIILLGIIIGAFLEKTGGANKLASVILKLIGPKRLHMALGLMGYVVSIPVFADSGFIILSPLNKALTRKAGVSLAGTALALGMGLMATHTMVPPTPGPIAAASILNADLGQVILFGLATSLVATLVTVYFAKKIGERIYVSVPEEPDTPSTSMPSTVKSFLPIIIPIVLIVLKSIADYPSKPFGENQFVELIRFLGNPVAALAVGVGFALLLPKKLEIHMLSTTGWVGEGLLSGATILLITCAGGAFGSVLQASDIGTILGTHLDGLGLGLWLPFLIAGAIRAAQGSSTVAIITTASLVAPLLGSLGLDYDIGRVLTVLAIGAGSAVASHANDSFFWVVTQMSNMSVRQGVQVQTVGSTILGLSAILFLVILHLFI